MGKYDDIIKNKYEGVPGYRHMSNHDRAAQFSPFAALVGYDKVIEGRGLVYDEKLEVTEDELAQINNVLTTVKRKDLVEVLYYDKGYYINIKGQFEKYDQIKQTITIDKKDISLDDVKVLNIISDVL